MDPFSQLRFLRKKIEAEKNSHTGGPGRPRIGRVRNFTCPDYLWEAAESEAKRLGISVSEWIRKAMEAYI